MSRKQKIYLISPDFPPVVSGVGDHTAHLAAEIDREGTWEVKVLTGTEPVTGMFRFPVERAFDLASPRSIASVVDLVARDQPDWMIVQYNPFGYGGRYGFNPRLIVALQRIKRRRGRTKLGLIVHESFVTARDWRSIALSLMLKGQLWCMCQACDVVFTVVDHWAQELQSWFPLKRIEHLPVGSNIPFTEASKTEVRRQLNIEEGTVILGYFGRVRGSRSMQSRKLKHLTATVEQAQAAGIKVLILYLGLDTDGAKELLGHLPLLALGPLAAEDISAFLAAVDIYLLPITGGVSTRRTSLMCAMQHRLPIVATSGPETDWLLQEKNRHAFLLIPEQDVEGFAAATVDLIRDPDLQMALSTQAQTLFVREFTWNQISAKLLTTFASLSYVHHARICI